MKTSAPYPPAHPPHPPHFPLSLPRVISLQVWCLAVRNFSMRVSMLYQENMGSYIVYAFYWPSILTFIPPFYYIPYSL